MNHYKVVFKDMEPIVIRANDKEDALKRSVNQVIESDKGTLSEKEVLLTVKKVKKVIEKDGFTVIFNIALVLTSISTTYSIYIKWGQVNLWLTLFLFAAMFFMFLIATSIVFGLIEGLNKMAKNEHRKYCLRRKYAKYFKRFNVMLPGETITFKDMENDHLFSDASRAYFFYKKEFRQREDFELTEYGLWRRF